MPDSLRYDGGPNETPVVAEPEREPDFPEQSSLKRELLAELGSSRQDREAVPVDQLRVRWPSRPNSDPASLLFEGYQNRSQVVPNSSNAAPQTPVPEQSVADLIRIREILRSIGNSASEGPNLRIPEVGEKLFGFELCRELGRGAFARVFLARQDDLAGRPVVLKVSRIEGTEPQTLAQLQHTNIVPVYSVHEDGAGGVRALCMPYFGKASLSDVLRRLWHAPTRPNTGAELVAALDAVEAGQTSGQVGTASGRTPRDLLRQLTYTQSAAWIVAALADGLAHAHQRGVLHRDIKPSNILLATDGQPMLLDFNLAQNAMPDATQALLGGTIAYMSPEHLRAMSTRSPALARCVDQRADIYSLGMVLFELLSGRSPFDESASHPTLPILVEAMAVERGKGVPSLREMRPEVPWSLESVTRRCLAPDPVNRYQRAEELAEDLRCFLEDRPLQHAPELSLVERGEKWVRRHPRLSWAGLVATVSACLLLAVVGVLASVHTRLEQTGDQLDASKADERRRQFEEAVPHALFYVNTRDEVGDHLALGERVCRDTLGLYEVLDREDWQDHPHWRRLTPDLRARLAANARELLLLLADVRVRRGRWEPSALREALTLLERAEQIRDLQPCKALWSDRAEYLARLGERPAADDARQRAEAVPATTARDHYLLAMTAARSNNYRQALAHLDEAVRLNPQDYWAWMQRGLCHQEQGQAVLAVGDFGTCVGLRPDYAWGYHNRAVALTAYGERREAVADYQRALERNPNLLSSRINCAVLHLELKEYVEALEAFRLAQAGGREDAALHSGRGIALEGLGRHEEADAAFALAEQRAADATPIVRMRIRRAYGFAVAARLPQRARIAFAEVLGESPRDHEALYGFAMLHDREGEQTEALRYFTRALRAAPAFEEARRCRAVVLARLGDFQAARLEIVACLNKDVPSGGAYYAAACVAALEAEKSDTRDDAPCVREALQMLREAFARGYGQQTAKGDRDLKGVRNHPEFLRLAAAPNGQATGGAPDHTGSQTQPR